jgi:glycosyltransferase involved in cell wall biosynthesis
MQVLLGTARAWHLRQTARAFSNRGALAGLWMADNNKDGVPPALYRRCWAYHLAMKPFYHLGWQILDEKATYRMLDLWKPWIKRRLNDPQCPRYDVAQAIIGFATEIFDAAERKGALKVADCPNTHPVTNYGFWQRECDIWCPGEQVPIPRRIYARMTREIERADVVLVQSKFSRESMVLNGIPEDKVLVNPLGVDTSVFKKREEVPKVPRFVCVGTICLRKGHQYLFRAFQIVKKRLPEAELICVGCYKNDFKKEKPKWQGTFTHYPFLDHARISELLRTCTAFVFPSQEEGIARAQMEGLASGLPLIGTHEGGATTLVDDRVEGFIVRGRDPQHIAEAMIRIATDASLNRRMGEAAYLKGGARNSWQDYGDRLLEEYDRRLTKKTSENFR